MGDAHRAMVGRQMRMLFERGTTAGLSDGELLEIFVSRRDEARRANAFAAGRIEMRWLPSSEAGLSLDRGTAPAAVPTQLVDRTICEGMSNLSGGVATTAVARLAQRAVTTMLINRLRTVLGGIIVTAVLATGATGLARSSCGPAAESQLDLKEQVSRPNPGQPPRAHAEDQAKKSRDLKQGASAIQVGGRVDDEDGQPIPNAAVRLRVLRTAHRPLRIAAEVVGAWRGRTDAEGRYIIDGVRREPGDEYQRVALDVDAPGYVPFTDCLFSDLSPAVTRNKLLSNVRLRRGIAVTGRCVSPGGKGVAGAKIVSAYDTEPMSALGRTVSTDGAGRFRLMIPADRAAELIIYPELFAPRRVSVPAGGGDLGDIKVEVGVELLGRLESPRSVVFVGKGRAEGLTATALLPNGLPLADKVIAFESTDRGRFGWFPITLAYKTNKDGKFRVPAVSDRYKVWVAQAHESGSDDSGPIVGTGPIPAVMPQIFDFDSHGDQAQQELVLVATPEVAIRGTITGLDGKPMKGVCLWFLAGMEDDNRLTTLRWTTTYADGRYALTGLPIGLKRSFLNVSADPPNKHVLGGAVASGRFQGRVSSSGVAFEPLALDQNPLDFRVKFEPE